LTKPSTVSLAGADAEDSAAVPVEHKRATANEIGSKIFIVEVTFKPSRRFFAGEINFLLSYQSPFG
jgi:hypothetical protein